VVLRLIIIILCQELRQQSLHTCLLVLMPVVLVVISSDQLLRLVLAYSSMLPLPEDTPPRTAEIINHIIKICGFSSDLMMVKYIDQQ
jgi:hypothetical protein